MKAIRFLARVMNIVACGALAAMMLLTVSDVFLRYAFRRPIVGATELTEILMTCLSFLAFAWCALQRAHLKVDLVMDFFSPRIQAFVDGITCLAGLGMVGLIAWLSFLEAGAMKELNMVSSLLKVPSFPFYLVMAMGFAVLCVVMAAQFIQDLSRAVKK